MTIHSGQLRLSTAGDGDAIDITEGVQSVVDQSGVSSGLVSVFVPGSTAAVTTMAYEPGTVRDLHEALERLTEERKVRAAVVGPSETLPVRAGRIDMAARQQLVLIDFDDRSRERTVIVQVAE